MSVLYKALQKAEKENEQRHAASGLDAEKLVGSGAVKLAARRGLNWRVTGMAAAVVLAGAIGAAFFLVDAPPRPTPAVPTMTQGQQAAEAPAPVLQPPASAEPTPSAPGSDAEPSATADAAASAAPPEMAAATGEVDSSAPPTGVAADSPPPPANPPSTGSETAVAARMPASPSAPMQAQEPMPEIAADSPARMLAPPVNISRAEFALAGVGNAVQVREVSQDARNNVRSGYNALLRGEYERALGFYDEALSQEPQSVLALLGRGAALQKMRRSEEAQESYSRVLRIDPENREALTNLTALIGERSPGESLNRLLELERENPGFSPIKAQIGLAYAKLGSMDQALDYLRRAVALNPEATMYQYNMALVLDHMALRDQAIVAYESVLDTLTAGRGPSELSSTEIERRVRYLRTR